MSFFNELKRRNVIRVGIAYLVVAWLLIQVSETVFPLFGFDDTPARLAVIILAIGFMPALVIAWIFEWTPEGIKQEKEIDRSQSVTPVTGRKLDRAIIVVLVVALGYFAVDKFVLDPQREEALQQAMAKTLATASDKLVKPSDARSIAVLPFTNMSGDPANEPFTLGIHDDLLTHLSRIKSLRTSSRTSVLQYEGTTMSIPEIAAELGVTSILEGGIQRSGNRVRINLQLIDAQSDKHLWAEIYDRELTVENLFDVQGEIASEVTTALQATLLPEEREALKAKPTENIEAYDLYLLGRHHWNERTSDSMTKACDFFSRAIEIDPDFVLAHSGLADCYVLLVSYGNMTGTEAYPLAQKSVDLAMSLDDSVSEVWASKGLILEARGKESEAANALVRAIELDQQNFSAWLWYANTLLAMRRWDEHIAALQTAFDLEPMSKPVNNNLGTTLLNRGDFDRSLEHLERLVTLEDQEPQKYSLLIVQANYWSGDLAKAVAQARKILSTGPLSFQAMKWLIDSYSALGDYENADLWVERVSLMDPSTAFAQEVFEGRMDFEGGLKYMEGKAEENPDITRAPFVQFALFRMANLAGQVETAKSYLSKYMEDVKNYAEVSPSASWQRSKLRLAEFLINQYRPESREFKQGQKIVDEALTVLLRLNSFGYKHPGTYYGIALAQSLKGEQGKALDALDHAVHNGFVDTVSLAAEPALDSLRKDPRFLEIVGRMDTAIEHQRRLLSNMTLADYQPDEKREVIDLPRSLLDKYAGYYSDGNALFHFYIAEDGRFSVTIAQQPEIKVLASTEDRFFAEDAPGYSAQFFVDENGQVTHIMANGGGNLNRFKAVDPPPLTIQLDREVLQRYQGYYRAYIIEQAKGGTADSDASVAEIRLDENSKVWIHYKNQPALEIRPYSETEFVTPGFVHRLRFVINPLNGAVDSMVLTRDGVELEYRPQ